MQLCGRVRLPGMRQPGFEVRRMRLPPGLLRAVVSPAFGIPAAIVYNAWSAGPLACGRHESGQVGNEAAIVECQQCRG